MGGLESYIPFGGFAGAMAVLVAVIGYLLNSNRQDRKEYQQAIDLSEARAAAAWHERELADKRTDEALERARKAEARESRLEAKVEALQDQVTRLQAEVAKLRLAVAAGGAQ